MPYFSSTWSFSPDPDTPHVPDDDDDDHDDDDDDDDESDTSSDDVSNDELTSGCFIR